MKKNQQKSQKLFEHLESKMFDDLMTRRPLNEKEKRVLTKLRAKKELSPARTELKKELERLGAFLQKGQKYPILARNTTKVKQGRRFVYLGVDGKAYIGRIGKPYKVQPGKA